MDFACPQDFYDSLADCLDGLDSDMLRAQDAAWEQVIRLQEAGEMLGDDVWLTCRQVEGRVKVKYFIFLKNIQY